MINDTSEDILDLSLKLTDAIIDNVYTYREEAKYLYDDIIYDVSNFLYRNFGDDYLYFFERRGANPEAWNGNTKILRFLDSIADKYDILLDSAPLADIFRQYIDEMMTKRGVVEGYLHSPQTFF